MLRNTRIVQVFCLLLLLACLLVPSLVLAEGGEVVHNLVGKLEAYSLETKNQYFLLGAIVLATLISEDLACIAAGLLAAKSVVTPVGAVVASGLGIYVGDLMLYLAGYLAGIKALHRPPLKWFIKERMVAQCKLLFERRGIALIISSRFLPGTRTATFFGAGMVGVNPIKLSIVFGITVIIWTPILVLASMKAGELFAHYFDIYSRYAVWLVVGVMAAIFFISRCIAPLFTWKGRRLLQSRWRRTSHWEFWPWYVINSVTFVYVLYLGFIKYRRPTLFTITNPGIQPDSGFLWESKGAILEKLSQDYVGRWTLVKEGLQVNKKIQKLVEFQATNSLSFPIVLKPDRGQRGEGVRICRTEQEAVTWIKKSKADFIIMEYLPGEEFGVFYYRLPTEPKGKILSVTKKKLLSVRGDGKHTLEELILLHDRALCMAPYFLKEHQENLLSIIPNQQLVALGELGTHSRGSLFLDGNDLISPELLVTIEEIVTPYKGFYFGRFDVKSKNGQSLQAGKDIKVIELNGVTSEATHIYDPRHSVISGWKSLMNQWTIAFNIASINLKNGDTPMVFTEFFTHLQHGGK